MLGKILLTLGVILAVALIWRTRRPPLATGRASPRLINPSPGRRWPISALTSTIVMLAVLASSYLLYEHWRDNSEVIYVRVVEASSGRAVSYRAQRGDIEDREFLTVDGRRIVLADTERLETSTVRPPSSTVRY